MSNQLRSLDRITIPTPCDADWDSMAGNDQIAPNGWPRRFWPRPETFRARVRVDHLR